MRGNVGLRLRYRWIGQMQQRRLDHGEHDEYVHRAIARQTGGANLCGNTEPSVNLHSPRVATLHLWEKLRRLFLLIDGAAHAALAEVNCHCKTCRTGADDQNIRVRYRHTHTTGCTFTRLFLSFGGPERSQTSDLRFRKPPDCQQDICGRTLKCKNC